MKRRFRVATMFANALIAASLTATAAMAQESGELAEIIVTGSRIASPNATSVSPIVALDSQELKLQGLNDTADIVDFLPQHITGGNDLSDTNNPLTGPGGVTTINLRGLGPQRTLVLVNGRRLGVGDPNSGNPTAAADINQVPAVLIDRVDVVTGGASAVYGSDAIAGVVNFILKRDFEGLQLDAQYGFNQHTQHSEYMQGLVNAMGLPLPKSSVTDGNNIAANLVVGSNFADGRGNATAYLSYLQGDPVTLARRDFSSCQLSGLAGNACGGSGNSNQFISLENGRALAVVGNTLVPYSRTANTNPPPLFNSNPYMNLVHDVKRYQAGVLTRYDLTDNAQLYVDFMFMASKSNTEVAPSGMFIGDIYPVSCTNPMMTLAQRTAIGCTAAMIAANASIDMLIGRRNVEGGPRQFLHDHKNYRGVVGVKGDINEAWNYDAYVSHYDTSLYNTNRNYLSITKTRSAINGCVDGAPGCVPYNIWTTGAVTSAATDYIATFGIANGVATQSIFSASVSGDLGTYGAKLPSANEGVAVAVGAEYRKDKYFYEADANLGSGDLSGSGGASPSVDASTNVKELFAEVRVPLVQGRTGVQNLTFEAGYRFSDYELSGGADTYKAGLQWTPVEALRFRASYQKAIRAPSLIELFVPQTVTNTSDFAFDPCAGPTPTASLVNCQRTGVTAAQYRNIPQCIADQCAVLTGGNPGLKPEEAETISFGLTIAPKAWKGFTASFDWYQIKVNDIVGNIPLEITFDKCLDGSRPEYCQFVRRATGSGILFGTNLATGGYIVGTNQNVSVSTFEGVDIQVGYRFEIGRFGSLAASFNGVYMLKNSSIPLAGELEYDCAGLYGNTCGSAIPDYRHTMRVTWDTPSNIDLSLQWRYIGSVGNERNSSDPTLGVPADVVFAAELGARSYLDLSGIWNVNKTLSVNLGVSNMFDQDPPLVSTTFSGPGTPNTWGPYDTMGRQIFFGVTAKF